MRVDDLDFEPEQYVDAALKLHGLPVDGVYRSEVEKQFRLLMSMMEIIDSDSVPFEVEPANIFRL